MAWTARIALVAVLLAGCPEDEPSGEPVTIRFDGRVGDEAFACGGTFGGVGSSGTELETRDLRFYVHDVRLVRADGTDVPVTLDEDGMWQTQGVALLDFEDGSGRCEGGNPQLNAQLSGTAPAGDYTGLRFALGVPFELNHDDHVVAPPPLNLTSMFWDWMGGYKFLRFDGATTGQPGGMRMHLGSTGCTADATGRVTTPCANENRASIELDGFDPGSSVVVADVAGLFADANLDTNADGTPPGCMADATDPDCAPVFANLGLAAGGTQRFFRVE